MAAGEEEVVSFKEVAPVRAIILQWVAPYACIYEQHQLDLWVILKKWTVKLEKGVEVVSRWIQEDME